MTWRRWVAVCVVAGLAGVCVWACGPTPRQRHEQRLADTGKPALHGVHSARLQNLMGKLRSPSFDYLPQEMNVSGNTTARYKEMATVAAGMAETASHISEVVDDLGLDEAEARLFLKMADELAAEAKVLQAAAEAKNAARVESAMDSVTATCNACHSAFRIMPAGR
ncbi:MAG: cytochrome c [Phycisphaerae bacterium]|nr:cytochrome c [Phycisphaerae bacterium]